MLAGLLELLPWLKQWHPEPDADTGEPFGTFLEGECRQHGFTYDDLRAWPQEDPREEEILREKERQERRRHQSAQAKQE